MSDITVVLFDLGRGHALRLERLGRCIQVAPVRGPVLHQAEGQ